MSGGCWRLEGQPGQPCENCGRVIERIDTGTFRGQPTYITRHVGMAERLQELNEQARQRAERR